MIELSGRWGRDLQRRVLESQDKVAVGEAIRLYRAKFYRSSYIYAWIVLAESIRSRVKIAADSGERPAQIVFAEIERLENAGQGVDKVLIEAASSLSLVPAEELSYLNTFWGKRCIFAHPYEKAPTKEEVRFIIAHIVEMLLSKQLYHRKQFIDNELQSLKVAHYLIDDEAVIRSHAQAMLSRIAPDLFSYFFKSLLYEIGQRRGIATELRILRRLRYFLIELVQCQSEKISQNAVEYRLEHYAGNFPRELVIGCCSRETWQKLPGRIQQMLIDFILDNAGEQYATISPTNVFLELLEDDLLDALQAEQFRQRLTEQGFARLTNFMPFNDIVADAIIAELQTGDFQRIIPVISYVRNIDADSFSRASPSKLLQIGRKILTGASGNSWACQGYISDANRNIDKIPEAICAGMFLGQIYPYDQQYFARYDYLKDILPLCKAKFARASLEHWRELFALNNAIVIMSVDEMFRTIIDYPLIDEHLKHELEAWN